MPRTMPPLTESLSDEEFADITEVIVADWDKFLDKYNGKVPILAINMASIYLVRSYVTNLKSRPFITESTKRELRVLERVVGDLLRDLNQVRRLR